MPQTSITVKYSTAEYDTLKKALELAADACYGNFALRDTPEQRGRLARLNSAIAKLRSEL
jgi:hypothetical protein